MVTVVGNQRTVSITTSSTPAYIAALAPFDALQLPVSQNGQVSIFDTLNHSVPVPGALTRPDEWLSNDPGDSGYEQVIQAWSGGGGDGDLRTLWVHGGGHSDSANNGVYRFDFNGDPWVGATIDHIAAVADVNDQADYDDGSPGSIHTYQGMFAFEGSMYRMPGSRYRTNGSSDFNDIWRNTDGTWTKMAYYPPGVHAIGICCVNKSKRKAFLMNRGHGQITFYDFDANTYSPMRSYSGTRPEENQGGYHSAACNEDTGEVLIIGNGWSSRFNCDWDNDTIAGNIIESVSISGYPRYTAPVLVWDPTLKDYWAFGGNNSHDWSNIYRITGTGASKSATPEALSQTVTRHASSVSLFNRGFIMDADRAIGLVSWHNQAPWVIRLPSV